MEWEGKQREVPGVWSHQSEEWVAEWGLALGEVGQQTPFVTGHVWTRG